MPMKGRWAAVHLAPDFRGNSEYAPARGQFDDGGYRRG
jgi:hypothetical protein